MGNTMSFDAAINAGFGFVIAVMTAFAFATKLRATRVPESVARRFLPKRFQVTHDRRVDTEGMTAEVQDGTPTHLKPSLRYNPPRVPALPQAQDEPLSGAASTSTCISDTPHNDLVMEAEENSRNMAPMGELILGTGANFAADAGRVENPDQVIGQYIEHRQKEKAHC